MADLLDMEAAVDAAGGGGGGMEVVMFPWLAFGHMIPFLELSKRLAAGGHSVAFVSTPRNLARLPAVPAELSARVRLVPLQLPSVEGLPEGAESTADVPPEKIELVKKALDGLAGPFAAFLAEAVAAGRKPDWVIHDFCHHWVAPIADEHQVPCAAFLIVQAAFAAFLGSREANAKRPRTAAEDFTVPPNWIPFHSAVAYRRHETGFITGAFVPNASGVSDMERTWQIFERTRLSIFRSCDEVEPGMFALLSDIFQKPALPAGVLLPSDIFAGAGPEEDGSSSASADRPEVLRWLDKQPAKSVIYVALGSEAPVTTENVHELALGLEIAGVRFLWALRKPAGIFSADELGVLPDGFEERTRERGVVRTGWVPQVKVLAHAAVGAFLTHCGWGSTVESFAFGHPLVMLPFAVDQPLIARAMAERAVGVEVARDESGSFGRSDVAAAVRLVMVEEEGKVLAGNAQKLSGALRDQQRQDKYIDHVVEHLTRHKHGGGSNFDRD